MFILCYNLCKIKKQFQAYKTWDHLFHAILKFNEKFHKKKHMSGYLLFFGTSCVFPNNTISTKKIKERHANGGTIPVYKVYYCTITGRKF